MLEFLLSLNPALAIFIFALIVALIVNTCYRFLMNQEEVERLKSEIERLNEEMKKHKEDKEKVQKYLTQILQLNNKLMSMSFKPMLASMLLILLLLPGLSNFYGNVKINENTKVEGVSVIKENGKIKIGSKICEPPCRMKIGKFYWNVRKDELERIVAFSPIYLPIIGDDFGWFSWYILCTFALMLITKKLMGIKV